MKFPLLKLNFNRALLRRFVKKSYSCGHEELRYPPPFTDKFRLLMKPLGTFNGTINLLVMQGISSYVELKPENATRVRAQPHNTSLIRDLWTEMSQLAKYPSCLFPTIKRKCQRVELYSRSQPLWNSQTLRWSNFSLFVFLFQISISLPLSLFPAPFLLTLDKYTFALLALVSVNAIEIIVRREEEDTIILFKCKRKRWRDNRIV